jgi:hypothetical protein
VELLEQAHIASQVQLPASATTGYTDGAPATEIDERAARRSLRQQIDTLERQLADAFVTAFRMGGLAPCLSSPGEARVLDLGELERVRDELAERLRESRVTISRLAEIESANRVRLERMLLDPARYRFHRVSRRDVGEWGCGVWQVRPRLGLIGMMMGWWQVKLSSGCPLAMGRSSLLRP